MPPYHPNCRCMTRKVTPPQWRVIPNPRGELLKDYSKDQRKKVIAYERSTWNVPTFGETL